MKCRIVATNTKWLVILEDGEEVFSGETRQDCLNYIFVNGLVLEEE